MPEYEEILIGDKIIAVQSYLGYFVQFVVCVDRPLTALFVRL